VILSNAKDFGEDNKFDFGSFENFELTKNIFIAEQHLVRKLKKIRNDLNILKTSLSDRRTISNEFSFRLKETVTIKSHFISSSLLSKLNSQVKFSRRKTQENVSWIIEN
jgi:thiamine pyrophosphokinase